MIFPPPKPFYHFSIDDVIDSLFEISDKRLKLFHHPLFAFLKQLHKEFQTNVDLYCFYQKQTKGTVRTLSGISDRCKKDFQENQWLRLAPHALEYAVAPYQQQPEAQRKTFNKIYKEIARITGRKSPSKLIRLHYFSESFELAGYFQRKGVGALLTTDKPAVSYRLPELEKGVLKKQGYVEYKGIYFVRSHFRAENLAGEKPGKIHSLLHSAFKLYGFVTFFTHEVEMVRPQVRTSITSALRYLHSHKIVSL